MAAKRAYLLATDNTDRKSDFYPFYLWLITCKTTIVIRITTQQESSATRLFLEGKLAGPCVEELDKCWQTCPSDELALLVDLTNVSFVDDHGKELLAQMHNTGIKLLSTSLMTKCLIEEIENTATTSGDHISSRDQLSSQEEIR